MRIDVKKIWKTKKKLILSVSACITAAALGCGIWYYVGHNSSDPVYVYPFQFIGMTEYWGDSQESYGPVTTDKIQTVFLTDTQTVTEILVKEGQTVKKGDLLMTFDTTLSDLQLERKRLDVEKLKLQLQDAQKELRRINSMKPMEIPEIDEDDTEDVDLGYFISGDYEISTNKTYDGSSAQKAIICWIKDSREIDDDIFRAIQDKVSDYQYLNQPEEETQPTEPQPTEATSPETEPSETTTPETEPPETTTPETDPPETEPPETDPPEPSEENIPPDDNTPSSASEFEPPKVREFHAVFKVTSGNVSRGETVVWQGVKVEDNGDGFSFWLESAKVSDHMMEAMGGDDAVDIPQIDMGSGYTAAQIAQMRSEQQKKIKDLQFQIRMAEAEYKIMQAEVDDGNVYAQIDGAVISCLSEEEAKQTRQPVLKVSGGGGFYVEGFVSELEKDNMQPGQEVTINDWNSGMTYTGTVESIGDFPTREGDFSGNGNPNASFYPFMVFVDGEADLQAGSYVSVMYSTAESENGVYLENPFLRTENGRSYVLVQGTDGKLEQRFVTTGKSLWGNYTQILSGLTAEDLIAFPYGKNVKPGVAAIEGDMSNLYG